MVHTFRMAAASAAVLTLFSTALAQQPSQLGTADQAKAMLMRAVAAVKADKAKALDMFIKGEDGFLENGLYPFCWNVSDGRHVATRAKHLMDQDIKILKDSTGKAFGLESYTASLKPEGQITEVSYMFPRPAAGTAPGQDVDFTTPAPKVSFVTRVGDVGCGVGYFK